MPALKIVYSQSERDFLRNRRSKGAGGCFSCRRKTEQSGLCSGMAPPVGLEPTTLRLTAACSTD